MTQDDQRALAQRLDAEVLRMREHCFENAMLLNAMASRVPDLMALMTAAGPVGMDGLVRQFPNLGRLVELFAGLPKASAGVLSDPSRPASPRHHGPGGSAALRPDSLPFRLHLAASLLSRTYVPGAADAQSACRELASRLVLLEEALIRLLGGEEGAAERAREVLALDWS